MINSYKLVKNYMAGEEARPNRRTTPTIPLTTISGDVVQQPVENILAERPLSTFPDRPIHPEYLFAQEAQAAKLVVLSPTIQPQDATGESSERYLGVHPISIEARVRYLRAFQHPNVRAYWFALHGQSEPQLDYALNSGGQGHENSIPCTYDLNRKNQIRALFFRNSIPKLISRLSDNSKKRADNSVKKVIDKDPAKDPTLGERKKLDEERAQLEKELARATKLEKEKQGKLPYLTVDDIRSDKRNVINHV